MRPAKQWRHVMARSGQHEQQHSSQESDHDRVRQSQKGEMVQSVDYFIKIMLTAQRATSAALWFHPQVETAAICRNICQLMLLNIRITAPSPGRVE